MFEPRKIESEPSCFDRDNIKIYTVSESGEPVEKEKYFDRL